jgi:hypothetical protein
VCDENGGTLRSSSQAWLRRPSISCIGNEFGVDQAGDLVFWHATMVDIMSIYFSPGHDV